MFELFFFFCANVHTCDAKVRTIKCKSMCCQCERYLKPFIACARTRFWFLRPRVTFDALHALNIFTIVFFLFFSFTIHHTKTINRFVNVITTIYRKMWICFTLKIIDFSCHTKFGCLLVNTRCHWLCAHWTASHTHRINCDLNIIKCQTINRRIRKKNTKKKKNRDKNGKINENVHTKWKKEKKNGIQRAVKHIGI